MDAATFISTTSDLPLWRAAACALSASVFGLAWATGSRTLYPSVRRRVRDFPKGEYAMMCASVGVAAWAIGTPAVGDGPVVAAAFSMPDKALVCAAGADLVAAEEDRADLAAAYRRLGCAPAALERAFRAAQAKRDAAERAERMKAEEVMRTQATNLVAAIRCHRQAGRRRGRWRPGGRRRLVFVAVGNFAGCRRRGVEERPRDGRPRDRGHRNRQGHPDPLRTVRRRRRGVRAARPAAGRGVDAGGRVAAHLNVSSVGGRAASLRVSKPDNVPVVKGTLRPHMIDDILEVEYDLSLFPGGGAAVRRLGHLRMGDGTASALRVDAEDGQGSQWLVLTAWGSLAASGS